MISFLRGPVSASGHRHTVMCNTDPRPNLAWTRDPPEHPSRYRLQPSLSSNNSGGLYLSDAGLAPSAEQSTPRGRVVLPIFIRQGRPKAMSHLPWNHQKPLCETPFSQVALDRRCQKLWVLLTRGYVLSQ